MQHERRKKIRFPIMKNVGDPIELMTVVDGKRVGYPGFILDLSSGGVKIVTLGNQAQELHLGTHFDLDLKLPHIFSHHVEGKIIHVQKGEKAQLHHSDQEWFISLEFTKIKDSDLHRLDRMAEDWSICETKLQLRLPDVCFHHCSYFDLCEKPARLPSKKEKLAHKHG